MFASIYLAIIDEMICSIPMNAPTPFAAGNKRWAFVPTKALILLHFAWDYLLGTPLAIHELRISLRIRSLLSWNRSRSALSKEWIDFSSRLLFPIRCGIPHSSRISIESFFLVGNYGSRQCCIGSSSENTFAKGDSYFSSIEECCETYSDQSLKFIAEQSES